MEELKNREYWKHWQQDVYCDGSDRGFLELAVLYLLADQFLLWWHSNTNDYEILVTRDHLNKIIETFRKEFEDHNKGMGMVDQFSPGLLDPRPTVVQFEDTVQVRLLTFTKWGGFERRVVTFSRNRPHTLISEETVPEVEYDCGIIF